MFGLNNKPKAELESKVLKVSVKNCCGSWCIWLNCLGEETRVASVDFYNTDEKTAKKVANDFANKLRKLFNCK